MEKYDPRLIGKLIDLIGPLNNEVRELDGTPKLVKMWEIGDILVRNGVTSIHSVAWTIQDSSYITRDLLSYCFRIRRNWPTLNKLTDTFPHLQSFTAFREALPLIENKKFKLPKDQLQALIEKLNQNDPRIKNYLVNLKKDKIGKTNDRSQRLNEVRETATSIEICFNSLKKIVFEENAKKCGDLISAYGLDGVLKISQILFILSKDAEIDVPLLKISDDGPLGNLPSKLNFILRGGKPAKARLRRLVKPITLIQLADLLNSIQKGEKLSETRSRLY